MTPTTKRRPTITFDEALRRCRPGGEHGYCLRCRVYEPVYPFGGEDEALCPSCAYELAPAHPRLARALAAPRVNLIPLDGPEIPF